MTFELRTLGVVEVIDAQGAVVDAVLRQPKRLALLVYLAAKRPGTMESRQRLLALFWPELDEAHARNALNKTIHFLRKTLGEGIIVSHGRTQIGIDPHLLHCDAVDFRELLEGQTPERVIAEYLGDFLPGLYVTGAPAFEAWVDQERGWYRERARETGLELLERDLGRGRVKDAVDWSAFLDRIAPNDEAVVRAGVSALLRAGDRPAALQRLERYETWLRAELGTGVGADLVRLLNEEPAPTVPVGAEPRTNDPPPELLEFSRAAVRVESLEEFRALADQAPDMMYRCDIRGSFPWVNETLLKTMGYTREELRDKQYHEFIREDFQDRAIEFYVRQVDDGIPVTYLEFPAVTKDGKEIWVGQRVRLLLKDGEPVGTQAVARDITTRIRREAATRRTALEDRETRVFNRDAFALLGQQRIRESRRSREPFFTLHVRLSREADDDDAATAGNAVRRVTAILKETLRESDAIGRIDELELAILSASGDAAAGQLLHARVDEALRSAVDLPEMAGFALHCETVPHDGATLRSADALMTFAWVVER